MSIGQTGHVGRAKTALVTTLEGVGWQKQTKKQMYYVIYVQKGKGADRAASPGPPPDESFQKSFTQYLKGLQLTTPDSGSTVMSMLWCHPGKTGILGLLLCLYWQAEYSSTGKDWEGNVKQVESIFNNILISNM